MFKAFSLSTEGVDEMIGEFYIISLSVKYRKAFNKIRLLIGKHDGNSKSQKKSRLLLLTA